MDPTTEICAWRITATPVRDAEWMLAIVCEDGVDITPAAELNHATWMDAIGTGMRLLGSLDGVSPRAWTWVYDRASPVHRIDAVTYPDPENEGKRPVPGLREACIRLIDDALDETRVRAPAPARSRPS